MNWLQQCLTEDDNNSVFCYVRVLTVLFGLALLGLVIYRTIMDPTSFDIAETGRGFMEYLFGSSAAIYAKTKSGA